ncbi:mevalonate kinase [Nocardia sp. NPDC057030]|uniref:mevalonate kinase n=1 Tax=unclassified Nocardia TaxID=2637762 RepID=UPI003636ABD9
MTAVRSAPPSVTGTGSAHGKLILLGEHTVVYGAPAIAFPIPGFRVDALARLRQGVSNLDGPQAYRFSCGDPADDQAAESGPRVAVEEALRRWRCSGDVIDVVVSCDIPPARGLGSSAACACAAVRSVAALYGQQVDQQSLYDIVQCGEHYAHGRASGVDTSAALSAEPIWFQARRARPIVVGIDAAVVVADTGIAAATKRAVVDVREKLHRDPVYAQRLLDRAAAITTAAAEDLALGRATALGRRLVEFQVLLDELGVSTPELDRLIGAAHDAGALGAKLTGGGGGGCVIALTDNRCDPVSLSEHLIEAGAAETWIVPIRTSR